MQLIQSIQTKIYEVRGERIMLDFDLASLYSVQTRTLNQAVKRNEKRFPEDFMFQLTAFEWDLILHQAPQRTSMEVPSSQFVMMELPRNRTGKYLPYAFTEQGVAMLSGVLNSDKAISMNIAIMRAFVELRRLLLAQGDLREQLNQLKLHLGEHDAQLRHIYEAIENLLDEKARERKWESREKIGFKKE